MNVYGGFARDIIGNYETKDIDIGINDMGDPDYSKMDEAEQIIRERLCRALE